MVRPTKPKEMKPKAETSGTDASPKSGFDGNKIIVVNAVTTVLVCILFIGANYFIQDQLLSSKIPHLATDGTATDGEVTDGEGEDAAPELGIILDLGEFILNLSDVKSRRYLKINVAMELTKSAAEPVEHGAPAAKSGHGAPAAPDPAQLIEAEFGRYKPAVRDAIISTLSSKSAEELSSIAGKELAKEQIKSAVEAIFNGDREVLRVSFGSFIIQ